MKHQNLILLHHVESVSVLRPLIDNDLQNGEMTSISGIIFMF